MVGNGCGKGAVDNAEFVTAAAVVQRKTDAEMVGHVRLRQPEERADEPDDGVRNLPGRQEIGP